MSEPRISDHPRIPKSRTLLRDEMKAKALAVPDMPPPAVFPEGEPIPIKEIVCFNDFVAILQFRISSSQLELGDAGYKQEGMVVGVGPGLAGMAGTRCPSQLKMGDVISFYGNPTTTMEPKNGFYEGKRIVILPERSAICKLPSVPFILHNENGDKVE